MVAAIAASGSVTRAAGELHRTQSAVSHQLRGIEERLGTALFLRVGKRMVVTAAGERVLAAAHRVLEDIRATEEDVRRLGAREAGVVRVCAQCNTGYHWLPPLVEVFRRRHPEIEVSLAVECTLRPLEALARRKAGRRDRHPIRPPRSGSGAAALRGRACGDRRAGSSVCAAHVRAPGGLRLGAAAPLLELAGRQLHVSDDPAPCRRRASARHVRHAHRSDSRDGEGAASGSA